MAAGDHAAHGRFGAVKRVVALHAGEIKMPLMGNDRPAPGFDALGRFDLIGLLPKQELPFAWAENPWSTPRRTTPTTIRTTTTILLAHRPALSLSFHVNTVCLSMMPAIRAGIHHLRFWKLRVESKTDGNRMLKLVLPLSKKQLMEVH
jgi:hypothetical protein